MVRVVQPIDIAASWHNVRVYEDGACPPLDAVNVTEIAPAVVVDGATERLVGGLIELSAACGPPTPESDDAR